MAEHYIFADEAGCFTFNRTANVSTYFILCTVTTTSTDIGQAIHQLRHRMVWDKYPVADYFHATTDQQVVRDAVFEEILKYDFQVQATICEKAKAQPQVRSSKARFYKYPWYYHFRHGISQHVTADMRLLVTAASIGTKKERATFTNSLDDVMKQTLADGEWAVDFRPAQTDSCLQVADYCAWAIQRKWEKQDTRSYDLISDRIGYQYELWKHGKTLYY